MAAWVGTLVLGVAGCGEPARDAFAGARAYHEDNRAAHAAYARGDYREAETIFIRLLHRYARSYDAQVRTAQAEETWLRGYHALGWVRVAVGDYDKAISNFTSAAVYQNEHTGFLHQTLGFVSRLAGDEEGAERWLRKSLADPLTKDNRVARLSLAVLYCEAGRGEERDAEEQRLAALPEAAQKPLYPPNDASYWNTDQTQQETHYQARLAAATARRETECLPQLYRTLLALEGASFGLQTSDRYEERLRTMAETVETGRRLFGGEHALVAEALGQQARAVWQSANRFAHETETRVHRVRPRDAVILVEQQRALLQDDTDGGLERSRAEATKRRRGALDRAVELYEAAAVILAGQPEGTEVASGPLQLELERLREERAALR